MIIPYKELIDVSRKFLALLDEETVLLESHQMNQALMLLPQKESLAQYHAQCVEGYSEGEQWKTCSLEELSDLRTILDDLKDSLIKNQEALALIRFVQEGIMNKITQAIRDEGAPVYCYSKDRRQGINASAVSLSAFNERI